MPKRDNFLLRRETFLGRSGGGNLLTVANQIYLPTIDDNTLKIFHLIYSDSKVKKSFKKSLENSVISAVARVFLAFLSSFCLNFSGKIERKIAFRNATSRRNRMTEISFPFYIHFEIIYRRDSPFCCRLLVTEIYIFPHFVVDMHHKSIRY